MSKSNNQKKIINTKFNCTGKYIRLSLTVLIGLTFLFIQAKQVMSIQQVSGYVFFSDGSNVPNGMPVTINLTLTGSYSKVYTYGPFFAPNSYAETVSGSAGQTVIVRSWNETMYGFNVTTLVADPGTTSMNIRFNESRYSETNVTILDLPDNISYIKNDVFNVTANISILGKDATNCYAMINFSNVSVINVSEGETLNHTLGDINRLAWENSTWEITAKAVGSSNITVIAACNSDGVNLEKENIDIAHNITINATIPSMSVDLKSPQNNTLTSNTTITFYYNITANDAINNCSLIINNVVNQTNYSITLGQIQNFTVSNFKTGQYNWTVNCTNYDISNTTSFYNLTVSAELYPDMNITSHGITFSENNPVENQTITIFANISNSGVGYAGNVTVQFFLGNYTFENQIGTNKSLNISVGGTNVTNVTYKVPMGTSEIWVLIDGSNAINETNESNNLAIKAISIETWHDFVGNLSGALILSANSNEEIYKWNVTNITQSNVYIIDSDSNIEWGDLVALGRDKSNVFHLEDYNELDIMLGTENNTDSVNNTFLSNGTPRNVSDINIFSNIVGNISVVNSTNSSNFITGILWDSSDDSGNNEFDENDREDVVFITVANYQTQGKYGIYDFELKVPASLRDYKLGSNTVDFYVELK